MKFFFAVMGGNLAPQDRKTSREHRKALFQSSKRNADSRGVPPRPPRVLSVLPRPTLLRSAGGEGQVGAVAREVFVIRLSADHGGVIAAEVTRSHAEPQSVLLAVFRKLGT